MEPRLPEGVHALTERQREVAELVAEGLTNAEIGDRLGISLDGAKYHVSEVLTRLNLERREQIGAWMDADGRGRFRARALVGLVAVLLGGAAAGAIAGLWLGVPWTDSDPTSPDAFAQAGIPIVERTPEPDDTGRTPGPVGDLTNGEMLDLIYEPIPWHDARRTNRVPPRSVEQAMLRDQFVYQDGFQFLDEPTARFDADRIGGPACLLARVDAPPIQSGNWLLTVLPNEDHPGRYVLELVPSHPSVLEVAEPGPTSGVLVSPGPPPRSPVPLRIRAVDTSDWEATHVMELWRQSPIGEDGIIRLDYGAPRASRWLAVVTAGPMWGCFLLETERDEVRWPATRAGISPSLPAPDSQSPPEQPLITALGDPPPGTDERVCIEVGSHSARSGEVAAATGLSGLWSNWPPNKRTTSSPTYWLPAHPSDAASLQIRASVDGDARGPLHAFEAIDAAMKAANVRIWFEGSDPASDPPSETYVSHFLLPIPRTWSIVATVPPVSWGCFLTSVGLRQPTSHWD